MADEVHEVGTVLPVVDREGLVQADLIGVFPQQTRSDPVEGPRPCQCIAQRRVTAQYLPNDPLHAARHLGRRTPRKGHQQDPLGVSASSNQVGDAMGEGVRLARSRPRDDQERPTIPCALCVETVLDGAPLFRVELGEVVGGHRSESAGQGRGQ